MKLIVSKTAIEMAVKNICRVINPKNALPILGDVLCEANQAEKTLQLTGSDSETWLQATLMLEDCEGEGRFCVSATSLLDALTPLSEQPVTILATTESDNRFTLEHQSGKAYFPIDNADEYPTPQPTGSDSQLIEMDAKELATAIQVVGWATANDDLRPVMAGVYFDIMQDKTVVTASDGHVLMKYTTKEDGCGPVGSFIMPKKVAKLLPQMLDWKEYDTCDVMFTERQATIEQSNWSLTFRLVEGKYPNYESVIPKDSPFWMRADRSQLQNSVRKVSPFTNESSMMLRCTIKNNGLLIVGEDYDFSMGAEDQVLIESNNPQAVTIGLKSSSLLAVLQKIPGMNVEVDYTDPNRAVTIIEAIDDEEKSKRKGEVLGLLMPMLVND